MSATTSSTVATDVEGGDCDGAGGLRDRMPDVRVSARAKPFMSVSALGSVCASRDSSSRAMALGGGSVGASDRSRRLFGAGPLTRDGGFDDRTSGRVSGSGGKRCFRAMVNPRTFPSLPATAEQERVPRLLFGGERRLVTSRFSVLQRAACSAVRYVRWFLCAAGGADAGSPGARMCERRASSSSNARSAASPEPPSLTDSLARPSGARGALDNVCQ